MMTAHADEEAREENISLGKSLRIIQPIGGARVA